MLTVSKYIIVILSLVVKVLKIQPEMSVHFVHMFLMWNSKEQLLDIIMPRSKTLSEDL